MRKLMILGASVALMLAPTAAFAQQQAPAETPTAPAPANPSAAPAIQSINIVDIKELPETTQSQVNDSVSKTSEADLQKLRASIDASPDIKAALDAKGMKSDQVVAASMGQNGALTLITKEPS